MNRRDALVAASRFDGVLVLGLRADGELTSERRNQLLSQVAAGEHVELELEVMAYEQKPGERNRKNIRIRDGAMLAFGRSAKGRPFLRDHDQDSVMSRGGTIVESAAEKRGDGDYAVRQQIRLSAPWACELALRGLLDTLSVGIYPTGSVTCSVHGTEVFEDCYCFRGDEVECDGAKQIVEWIYDAAEIVETSAVNVPAVPSAHIESIRSALALSLSSNNRDTEPKKERPMPNNKSNALPEQAHQLMPVPDAEVTNADLDAGLMKLGLSPARVQSLRANLRAAGLSDDAIRTELLRMRSNDVPEFADSPRRARNVAEVLGLDASATDAVVMAAASSLVERCAAYQENAFIEEGKKRGAIGLGYDEEEVRAAYRRSPREAQAMMANRPNNARTPVGLGRDSAPAFLPGESHPASGGVPTTSELDGALKKLGLSDQRVASMRNNLKAAGMSSVEIDNELRKMVRQ